MFQPMYINELKCTCNQSSSENLKKLYKSLPKRANPTRQSPSEQVRDKIMQQNKTKIL